MPAISNLIGICRVVRVLLVADLRTDTRRLSDFRNAFNDPENSLLPSNKTFKALERVSMPKERTDRHVSWSCALIISPSILQTLE